MKKIGHLYILGAALTAAATAQQINGLASKEPLAPTKQKAENSPAPKNASQSEIEKLQAININRIDDLNQIHTLRETIIILLERKEKDLFDKLTQTFKKGFENTGIKPNELYKDLGLSLEEGLKKSNEEILALLSKKIVQTEAKNDSKKVKALNNITSLFRIPLEKQNYDAYIQGKNAVERLKITEQQAEILTNLLTQVIIRQSQILEEKQSSSNRESKTKDDAKTEQNFSQQEINELSKINFQTIKSLIEINSLREIIFTLLNRQDEKLYDALEQSFIANFAKTTVNPKEAYQYFGIKLEDGIKKDHTQMMEIVNKKLAQAETEKDTKTLKILRQMGYLFRVAAAKQNYDAYLQGKEAVEKLKINPRQAAILQALLEKLQDRQIEILEEKENL